MGMRLHAFPEPGDPFAGGRRKLPRLKGKAQNAVKPENQDPQQRLRFGGRLTPSEFAPMLRQGLILQRVFAN
jgi:hypothetical protein